MPECDGFELIMAIRNMPQRPKIIAISGGSPRSDQEKLLRMAKWISADAVLSKPLQMSQLCDTVRKVLDVP
jgi:CheY-like chemotaxis protein